jgi:hypothetical protein
MIFIVLLFVDAKFHNNQGTGVTESTVIVAKHTLLVCQTKRILRKWSYSLNKFHIKPGQFVQAFYNNEKSGNRPPTDQLVFMMALIYFNY